VAWLSDVSVVCCQEQVCLLWVLCVVRNRSVCCECCVLSGRGLSVVSVVCCQVEVCLLWVLCVVR